MTSETATTKRKYTKRIKPQEEPETVQAVAVHNAESLDDGSFAESSTPTGVVKPEDLDLGFDASEFEAVVKTRHEQPKLPFRKEFKKAHLWQFSWAKWEDRNAMDGSQSVQYSALVRKGDAYRGHKFDEMFPPEAFSLDKTMIGKGTEYDPTTKTWTAALVLCVRPKVAFEKNQEAIVKITEEQYSDGGKNVNKELRGIVNSTGGDISMRSTDPEKPILRSQTKSRWVKTQE